MSDETSPQTRRERHKDERRQRIIDAASELLHEVGVDDMSVKMIAERADVSAATFYNLFGTKGAVLAKVYERDFASFEDMIAEARSPSALDAIFDSIRIATNLYRSNPNFYRGMAINNPRAEPELVTEVTNPRFEFWRGLLERAIRERDLTAQTRTDLVTMALLEISSGAFASWCADLISLKVLELQTSHAFALVLLASARPAARAKLQARIAAAETALSAPGGASVAAQAR